MEMVTAERLQTRIKEIEKVLNKTELEQKDMKEGKKKQELRRRYKHYLKELKQVEEELVFGL